MTTVSSSTPKLWTWCFKEYNPIQDKGDLKSLVFLFTNPETSVLSGLSFQNSKSNDKFNKIEDSCYRKWVCTGSVGTPLLPPSPRKKHTPVTPKIWTTPRTRRERTSGNLKSLRPYTELPELKSYLLHLVKIAHNCTFVSSHAFVQQEWSTIAAMPARTWANNTTNSCNNHCRFSCRLNSRDACSDRECSTYSAIYLCCYLSIQNSF